MDDTVEMLCVILRLEGDLHRGEIGFFKSRYCTSHDQVKLLARLKDWPHSRLVDFARCFLRERALLLLPAKCKFRFLGEQINIHKQSPEDPRFKELSNLYKDYSDNYSEVQKMYDQYTVLLQSLLTDEEFDELMRDVIEEITHYLIKG